MLVIDWGAIGPLHVFCAVMAWSRGRFVCFSDNERSETTLACLAGASSTWAVCRRPCSPIGWAV